MKGNTCWGFGGAFICVSIGSKPNPISRRLISVRQLLNFLTISIFCAGALAFTAEAGNAAGPATHLSIAASPDTVVAGGGPSLTVMALDAAGNVDTNFSDQVDITCTDPHGSLSDVVLTAGAGTFSTQLVKTGSQTFTAVDSSNSGIKGTSNSVNVIAGSVATVKLTVPNLVYVGQVFTFTIAQFDGWGNPSSDTLTLSSDDPDPNFPLVGSSGDYTTYFSYPHNAHLSAYLASSPSIRDDEVIEVGSADPNSMSFSIPDVVAAGQPFSVKITTYNFGGVAVGYNGTFHFYAESTGNIFLPDAPIVNGICDTTFTLDTPGTYRLLARDDVSGLYDGSSYFNVAGPVTRLGIDVPAYMVVDRPYNIGVTAFDANDVLAVGYTGEDAITSSDPLATVPGAIFPAGGYWNGKVAAHTIGNQTFTVTDNANSGLTATSIAVPVIVASSKLVMTLPQPVVAGKTVRAHIVAEDVFNKPMIGYGGVIHFSSTDPRAVLPASATLINGAADVNVIFKTAGRQKLSGFDNQDPNGPATITVVSVQPNVAIHFKVAAPASTTAGLAFNVLVSAVDVYGNTVGSYSGIAHFTSTDPQAVLPADVAITGGMRQFAIKLKTAGPQRISVMDTTATAIAGTSSPIAVGAASAFRLMIAVPPATTNSAAFYGTVKALDAFGNMAASYAGTVHFTSADPKAVLPADSTLINGTRQFSFKLKTKGNQTIKATDTVKPSLTITTAPISVS